MLLVMIFMLMFNVCFFFVCVCVWSSEFWGRIDANICLKYLYVHTDIHL